MKNLGRLFLLTLFYSAGTLARRGGGGGDYSDSGGDDSSDSGGGGSSVCIETHHLNTNDVIPYYELGVTVNGVPSETGAYYYGEAHLEYTLLSDSYSSTCSGESNSIRMLALAFVSSTDDDEATNSTNSFMIGLKAWESSQPVSNITYSYSSCSSIDKVHLMTTNLDWYGLYAYREVIDWWKLTAKPDAQNSDAVAFEGTMTPYGVNASDDSFDISDISNWMSLPGLRCDSELSQTVLDYGDSTTLTGSIANDTLELALTSEKSAREIVRSDFSRENITYRYNLTFSGIFDAVNSTEKLTVSQSDEPLMSWSKNAGVRISPTALQPLLIGLLYGALHLTVLS